MVAVVFLEEEKRTLYGYQNKGWIREVLLGTPNDTYITSLRSSDLLQRGYTCGRIVTDLQAVQRLHVLFRQLKVKDVGVRLDSILGLGRGNGNKASYR